MIQDRDLLRPSLTAGRGAPLAIYSARTGFLASFFGGPIAGALVALLNSQRLQRLRVDGPVVLLALVASMALRWAILVYGEPRLESVLGKGGAMTVARFIGPAFFGVVYALHRRYYRGMSLLAIPVPNGLRVGILASALGLGAEIALAALAVK